LLIENLFCFVEKRKKRTIVQPYPHIMSMSMSMSMSGDAFLFTTFTKLRDVNECHQWMLRRETRDAATAFLRTVYHDPDGTDGTDKTRGRCFLAILSLTMDPDMFTSEDPLDICMIRHANAMRQSFCAMSRAHSASSRDKLRDDFEIAKTKLVDWKARDSAAICGAMRANIGARVYQQMHKAYFDVMKEDITNERFGGTFSALTELQEAMLAFFVHSPKMRAHITDRFDVAWLRQRHEHGALDPATVRSLMVFVARIVARIQAPVDDPRVVPWLEETVAKITAAESPATLLPQFLRDCFDFLRLARQRCEGLLRR